MKVLEKSFMWPLLAVGLLGVTIGLWAYFHKRLPISVVDIERQERQIEWAKSNKMWERIKYAPNEAEKWRILTIEYEYISMPAPVPEAIILYSLRHQLTSTDEGAQLILASYPEVVKRLEWRGCDLDRVGLGLDRSGALHEFRFRLSPEVARHILELVTGRRFSDMESYREFRKSPDQEKLREGILLEKAYLDKPRLWDSVTAAGTVEQKWVAFIAEIRESTGVQ